MIFDHGTHTEKPVGSAHGLHGSTPSSSIRRSNRATQVSRWIGSTTRHAATSGAHPRRCDPGTGGLAREIPAGDADGASVRAWYGRELFSGAMVLRCAQQQQLLLVGSYMCVCLPLPERKRKHAGKLPHCSQLVFCVRAVELVSSSTNDGGG